MISSLQSVYVTRKEFNERFDFFEERIDDKLEENKQFMRDGSEKMESYIDNSISSLEVRLTKKVGNMIDDLGNRLDNKMDKIEKRVDNLETKVDEVITILKAK